jgi:hypothetical protein
MIFFKRHLAITGERLDERGRIKVQCGRWIGWKRWWSGTGKPTTCLKCALAANQEGAKSIAQLRLRIQDLETTLGHWRASDTYVKALKELKQHVTPAHVHLQNQRLIGSNGEMAKAHIFEASQIIDRFLSDRGALF